LRVCAASAVRITAKAGAETPALALLFMVLL
jgi:hypothetical protein